MGDATEEILSQGEQADWARQPAHPQTAGVFLKLEGHEEHHIGDLPCDDEGRVRPVQLGSLMYAAAHEITDLALHPEKLEENTSDG